VTVNSSIVAAGDSALVVEFADRIDPIVNAQAVALSEAFERSPVRGVRDVVPAYRSVTIYFDPLRTDRAALIERLERDASEAVPISSSRPPVRIPVCYGGTFGPDLGDVARVGGLTQADVIAIHSSAVYRVFMLGFVPGFAYMGSVDPRIAAARRDEPRTRVPPGSVGIAGAQTGVYPSETPGGWQLIGRTPVSVFDLSRPDPCTFRPGDEVIFYPIAPESFGSRADAPDP
jgi:inhibitor of KinA